MKLTKTEFNEKLKNNQLVLSLIGMSNIGKTFWSKKLKLENFLHISFDEYIEEKLSPFLKSGGYKGIAEVALWMGQPYENRSFKNQQKYLDFEAEVMTEVIKQLESLKNQNYVLDTTGSIVHLPRKKYQKLKNYSFIIYIESTPEMISEMFETFIKFPKPVIFGEYFSKLKDQTNEQALELSYKNLLWARSQQYKELADLIIPVKEVDFEMSGAEFLEFIKTKI